MDIFGIFFGNQFKSGKIFDVGFEPCGLFSWGHLFMVLATAIAAVLILYFFRNMSHKAFRRYLLVISIIVTSIEVIKIIYRSCFADMKAHTYIPLYFCSLFIFSCWFCLCKNEFLKNIGCAFVTMGGICGAVVFIVYPSTSLPVYPIWHFESIHSYIYHLIMICTGVIMITNGYYKPKKSHSLHYFIFITMASIPAYLVNTFISEKHQPWINCMFLKNGEQIPGIQDLSEQLPVLYTLIAFTAQAVLMFWINYLIYSLGKKVIAKIKGKKNSKLEIQSI